ncbi:MULTISPECIES: hypothetical protein [Lactobacillus]|uniref:hypothetical protein n=1 Tax=Lactobacillus TaxID=1578 RepID=UPI001F24EAEA|nr:MULTISPECIES: hypothetical protein [Lactobacillus]MCF1846936.1 hypothetical protein [Lactobacillus mulieris]MCZ3725010.1 hypothetical protein [Lactobacillus jensenii]MCZ3726536.1 hypothetical protein [Lactobacillus jensenii]MCZ3728037.1 hypothetical protein [Lactobacillus jensenii]MCZ3729562.1 hypothetical protein [Lactobacillus jensenii]
MKILDKLSHRANKSLLDEDTYNFLFYKMNERAIKATTEVTCDAQRVEKLMKQINKTYRAEGNNLSNPAEVLIKLENIESILNEMTNNLKIIRQFKISNELNLEDIKKNYAK